MIKIRFDGSPAIMIGGKPAASPGTLGGLGLVLVSGPVLRLVLVLVFGPRVVSDRPIESLFSFRFGGSWSCDCRFGGGVEIRGAAISSARFSRDGLALDDVFKIVLPTRVE